MRPFALFFAMLFMPALSWAAAPVSIYVCAHPDDCILFMNPQLYNDIAGGAGKTVILYLTAGDAGEPWHNDKKAYPYGREQASLLATEWMRAVGHSQALTPPVTDTVVIHGHRIRRVRSAQLASYFLRLPDGNMYAEGFSRYGNQSLEKLKTGVIKTLTAIDGSARYQGWDEIVATLGAIITRETQHAARITLHFPDTDLRANHDDHSDHQHGAQAVLQWLRSEPQNGRCYHLVQNLDYAIADLPKNMDETALLNSVSSFGVLTAAQQQAWGYHHWNEAHTRYLGRSYATYRTVPDGCSDAPRE